MKASVIRAILAGLAGGLALALTNFLTFGLLGGSRRGQTGLLFDPATQSHKVIAVYKEIEPLPYIVTRPYLILAGFVVFAIGHALLYRSVAAAWPARYGAHLWRLTLTVWFVGTLFFEFLAPFNLMHEPFRAQRWELLFWALSCTAEASVIVALIRPRPARPAAATSAASGPVAAASEPAPTPA
jgi:hypothetical protein